MHNPCIVSLYQSNINKITVDLQKQVVDKFNASNIEHYQLFVPDLNADHGDYMSDALVFTESNKHDAIMFLDIDCIPLSCKSIEYFFSRAYDGVLIGDIQRSNHIDNGQHVFAAPHNITFTIELYNKLNRPTFKPTHRGDTAEELTFLAEENNIEVELIMPIRYDASPHYFGWEKMYVPYWTLASGMPNYGIGTTFGNHIGELWWHNYQICQPGQQERFWNKCRELLQ
jgi:hypothetical protein